MKEIPLTQGKVARVDDADYDWLMQWKWRAIRNNTGKGIWYIVTGSRQLIYMHRLILNTPADMEVDHADGDGLNNQRFNLRNCTNLQNQANKRLSKANTSGYKGVSRDERRGKWRAMIRVDFKNTFLGHFDAPEEAARAYDAKARELFGEFAKTNFPKA